MSEPFIGEIRMFAGNFAPRGWAFCNGQLLSVSDNDALFSLYGTTYGGDGRTTFGLPDLRGRLAIHYGSGPGLTPRQLGHKGGEENVTLNTNQLASHTHSWRAINTVAQGTNPIGALMARPTQNIYSTEVPNAQMRDDITNTGGSQSHNNLQPFQCINYIVSLFGIYPSKQ